MPRTCLACAHAQREAIDKALVAGEPLRNIAKRVSISPAALVRHKSHVAGALVKAQERHEESLGDSIFDEMKRVMAKAWELLAKMEAEGDHRGSIVALREVRECLESLSALLTKAESRSASEIRVTVSTIMAEESVSEIEPPSLSQPQLPPVKPESQPNTFAIVPTHKARSLVGAVEYLQGMR